MAGRERATALTDDPRLVDSTLECVGVRFSAFKAKGTT
jgi:hypothetical protein